MLEQLIVKKLNGSLDLTLKFHEDLNILTGKNGCGKTTILKLIWYLMSGNIERVIDEKIPFEYARLDASEFFIEIKISTTVNEKLVLFNWDVGKGPQNRTMKLSACDREAEWINRLNRQIIRVSGSSVFFPTFRRVEGGFSILQNPRNRYSENPVQDAMETLARTISVGEHSFVVGISTDDIVRLLTTKYADLSEQTNQMHREFSTFITKTISEYTNIKKSSTTQQLANATAVLKQIEDAATQTTKKREELLRPFSVLSDLTSDIYKHKGISITDAIILGDSGKAISSEKLSSGEKQMLSFLSYNAFKKNSCIIIDEPEISLHLDWQRILMPTLLSQSSNNQFFIATHSPFIYTKYPDKELSLDPNKQVQ